MSKSYNCLFVQLFDLHVKWLYFFWYLLGIKGLNVLRKIMEFVIFSSYLHSLNFYFCWLLRRKRNEWRRDRNTFKVNFYFQIFNYIVEKKGSSQTVLYGQYVEWSEKEFIFGAKKPIFLGMRRLSFQSEAFWEILFFLYSFILFCVYFIFIFSYYCFMLLFPPQIPYNRSMDKLMDFNGVTNRHGLFHSSRLRNIVNCTFIFTFLVWLFLCINI